MGMSSNGNTSGRNCGLIYFKKSALSRFLNFLHFDAQINACGQNAWTNVYEFNGTDINTKWNESHKNLTPESCGIHFRGRSKFATINACLVYNQIKSGQGTSICSDSITIAAKSLVGSKSDSAKLTHSDSSGQPLNV